MEKSATLRLTQDPEDGTGSRRPLLGDAGMSPRPSCQEEAAGNRGFFLFINNKISRKKLH